MFFLISQVSLKTISNNWDVTNEVAKDVLNKWLDQNQKKVKQLVKEFLVRGINSDGKFFICVSFCCNQHLRIKMYL